MDQELEELKNTVSCVGIMKHVSFKKLLDLPLRENRTSYNDEMRSQMADRLWRYAANYYGYSQDLKNKTAAICSKIILEDFWGINQVKEKNKLNLFSYIVDKVAFLSYEQASDEQTPERQFIFTRLELQNFYEREFIPNFKFFNLKNEIGLPIPAPTKEEFFALFYWYTEFLKEYGSDYYYRREYSPALMIYRQLACYIMVQLANDAQNRYGFKDDKILPKLERLFWISPEQQSDGNERQQENVLKLSFLLSYMCGDIDPLKFDPATLSPLYHPKDGNPILQVLGDMANYDITPFSQVLNLFGKLILGHDFLNAFNSSKQKTSYVTVIQCEHVANTVTLFQKILDLTTEIFSKGPSNLDSLYSHCSNTQYSQNHQYWTEIQNSFFPTNIEISEQLVLRKRDGSTINFLPQQSYLKSKWLKEPLEYSMSGKNEIFQDFWSACNGMGKMSHTIHHLIFTNDLSDLKNDLTPFEPEIIRLTGPSPNLDEILPQLNAESAFLFILIGIQELLKDLLLMPPTSKASMNQNDLITLSESKLLKQFIQEYCEESLTDEQKKIWLKLTEEERSSRRLPEKLKGAGLGKGDRISRDELYEAYSQYVLRIINRASSFSLDSFTKLTRNLLPISIYYRGKPTNILNARNEDLYKRREYEIFYGIKFLKEEWEDMAPSEATLSDEERQNNSDGLRIWTSLYYENLQLLLSSLRDHLPPITKDNASPWCSPCEE